MNRAARIGGAMMLGGALLLASAAESRANLSYTVTLNTASLVGNANGAFSLDLALSNGSQVPNSDNTVTLSNFIFLNGSATGAGNSSGGVSGSLASSLVLTNSSLGNEFYQTFSGGVTQISFTVNQTTNTNNPFPDQFSVAILDGGLNNIPTTDPSSANTLVLANIATTQTVGSVASYQSTANGAEPGVTAAVGAVPEPSSVAGLLAGLAGLGLCVRNKGFRRPVQA